VRERKGGPTEGTAPLDSEQDAGARFVSEGQAALCERRLKRVQLSLGRDPPDETDDRRSTDGAVEPRSARQVKVVRDDGAHGRQAHLVNLSTWRWAGVNGRV
jgi:hypothetical protein